MKFVMFGEAALSARICSAGSVCLRWATACVVALLALLPLQDAAAGASADWTLRCTLGAQEVALRMHSPSGDELEDDMQIAAHGLGSAASPVALPPAWYTPVRFAHRGTSRCDGSDAFPLGRGRLLVLLGFNRRPGLDGVAAIWLDVAEARVLDAQLLPGQHLAGARLKPTARRLRLQLVDGYEGSADQAETPRLAWYAVAAEGDRLRIGR